MARKINVLFTIFIIFITACAPINNTDSSPEKTITTSTNRTTIKNTTIQPSELVNVVEYDPPIKVIDSKIPAGISVFLSASVSAREQEVIIFALQLAETMFTDAGESFSGVVFATNNKNSLARLIVQNFNTDYDEILKRLEKAKGIAYYKRQTIILNLELINSIHGQTIGSRDAALTFIVLHETTHLLQKALSRGMISVIPVSSSFIESSANEFAERAILRYLCINSFNLKEVQFPYQLKACDESVVQDVLHKQAVNDLQYGYTTSAMLDYFKVTYGRDTIEQIFRLLGTYFEQHPEPTIENYKKTHIKIQNLSIEIEILREEIIIKNMLRESSKQLDEQLYLLHQEFQTLSEIINLPWIQILKEISGLPMEKLQLQINDYFEYIITKKD